jgi:hypothetical protein
MNGREAVKTLINRATVAAATLAAAVSLLAPFLKSPEQTNRNTERFYYLAFDHLHFRI